MAMMIKNLFFLTVAYAMLVYRFILSFFLKDLDPMLEFFVCYGLSLASVVGGLRILLPKLAILTLQVGIAIAIFLVKIAFHATLFVIRRLLNFIYGLFEDLVYLIWFLVLLDTPFWLQQAVPWIVRDAAAVICDTFSPGGAAARHSADIKTLGDFSGWSTAALYWNIFFRVPIYVYSRLCREGRKVFRNEKRQVKAFLTEYSPRIPPILRSQFVAMCKGFRIEGIRSYQGILQAYRAIKNALKETVVDIVTSAHTLFSDLVSKVRKFLNSVGAGFKQRQMALHNFAKTRYPELVRASIEEWAKHNFKAPTSLTLRTTREHDFFHRVHRLQEPAIWFLTSALTCVWLPLWPKVPRQKFTTTP